MELYKPEFTDKKSGAVKTCRNWYLRFADNRKIRHRLSVCSNKAATEKFGAKIDELLSCGGVLSQDLQKWFENQPEKMRQKLFSFGLIDSGKMSANWGKTLQEHLKDFCDGMTADRRKPAYIKQGENNINKILNNCGFRVWSDIDGNKVKTFLAKSRGAEGYGEKTYNTYLRSFKEFCTWLIREDRVIGGDPMKGHSLIKQTEFRKKRRALTFDEIRRLLEATEAAPKRFNMSGHERRLIYQLAVESGMRAGELRSLKVLSFDFEATPPSVHVEAVDSKGKKAADLILMSETAKALKEFFKGKELSDKAFGMPHIANTAVMIRKDLEDAKISYTDDSGRDCDFHSLRHTFISGLALAQVHPAVAQKLARHSSIELTMRYYTHVLHTSEVAAIEALKNLSNACLNSAQTRKIANTSGQKKGDNEQKTALSA